MKNAMSLIRVGLCDECFAKHDKKDLKTAVAQLYAFEEGLQKKPLHSFAECYLGKLKNEEFTASVGYKKYWSDIEKKHGKDNVERLNARQFVDEVIDR
jgi:hypothetical protein